MTEAKVVESRGWDWGRITDPIWAEPSPELYAVAVRWKREGRGKILDLGCGIGRNSLFLAEMGFAVEAYDLAESGIARLRALAEERHLAIGLRVGDMLSLPYAGASFDCVLAFHVIYHTDRQGIERTLAEIRRVLRPGGEAFVTFNSKSNPSFRSLENRWIDGNTAVRTRGQEAGIPHYYVDEAEIRRLLARFEISRLSHVEEIGPDWRSCHYFAVTRKGEGQEQS